MNTTTIKKAAMTVAALGALGLGGSAIADAARDSDSSSQNRSARNHARPAPLSSDHAAKVKAAALDEVPGATVLRMEAGGPYPTPYHAHIRTPSGERRVVLVDDRFEATDVIADRGPRGRRPGGPGHPCPGEHPARP